MIPYESVELTGYLSKCGVWFWFQSETKIQGLYLFQQSQNNSHGPLEPERTLKNNLSQIFTLQVNFGGCSSSHSKTSGGADTGIQFSQLQALCPISPCKRRPVDASHSTWQITLAGHFVFSLYFMFGKILGASNRNQLL